MIKSIFITLAFCVGIGQACSFVYSQIRYDTLEAGVVRVVRITSGENVRHEYVTTYDTLGISRTSAFQEKLRSYLQDSTLVFIGTIDSVLQFQSAGDTVVSGISPTFVLRASQTDNERWPFFARVRVDTVLKGTLPSLFWIRSSQSGTSCDLSVSVHRGKAFLNVSNGLQRPSDLKLSAFMSSYDNFPTAHWFDGRYLVSPDFPGIRLDITEVLPTYPATGVLRRGVPWRPANLSGKTYQPDGRRVQNLDAPRKTPLPLLK